MPIHFGASELLGGLASNERKPSDELYRSKIESPFEIDPVNAFWTFKSFQNKVGARYADMISDAQKEMTNIEKTAFLIQPPVEKAALELYDTDTTAAIQMLLNYSNGIRLSALQAMREVLLVD
jgi:hypothetical protein